MGNTTLTAAMHSAHRDGVIDELRDAVAAYGQDAAGPWLVVRVGFHGGGIISEHTSALAAARRAVKDQRQHRATGCRCGCCRMAPESAYDDMPYAANAHCSALAQSAI